MSEDLDHQMDGKIAVITGSTQGLGEAVAWLFAKRGAAGLVTCGRNVANGQRVAESISKDGCATHFVEADLGRVEDCAHVVAAADSHFGRIDTLVNCAAITDRGTILDTSPELFDQIFAVNVRAPFFLTQDALKIMIREGIKGTVVNILSMSGHGGQSFLSPYCTSKGALAVLTKNTAFSVMRHNIRVNGLNIGWMDSPGEDRMQRKYHGQAEGWQREAEEGLPFGRMLKTDEVARAVAFLCSDESGMMTGSIVDFAQAVLGCFEERVMPPDELAADDGRQTQPDKTYGQ